MFKKAKITTLLAWGFGLVIALIAGMTLVVFLKSDSVNQNASRLAEDVNPKVTAAATIRLNIMRNWSNTLLLAQISDSSEARRITDEMAENSKVISEKFNLLEKGMINESEKSLLGAALKARQEYTDSRKKYLELLKAGAKEDASQLLGSSVRTSVRAYTDAIGKVFEDQSEKMVRVSNDTLAQSSLLKTTMLSIALAVVLISLIAAYIVGTAVQSILGGDAHYASKISREIASGNLCVEVNTQANNTDSLLYSMKTMRDKLREMVTRIQVGAEQVGQSAQQLAKTSSAVAAASAQQSAATIATAAAVEEMTVGIESISNNAHSAKTFSQEASGLSRKGGEVIHGAASEIEKIAGSVESSSAIISGLEQQSNEISTIVSVIKEIADQTNLLALNAAIEAARAGEQGRGFAVVADEVRKLAERTTQSTQQVALTIEKIQRGTKSAVESMVAGVNQVRSGTALAIQAGESIKEIQLGAENVVGVVSDISSALQEQSKVSAEIAHNIENIAQMVEENNSSSEQSASAARQLQQLAQELSSSVGSFRV
ncbi:methyl-accepting chemotaxis protein [Propionivibrio sp.]|uniref:methyl-accepting chemotaxis protein n=1 Tax=Propionivibrio sp. TaxID=2212460 RepID=UPI0026016AAE|nr:methyl-accepting chemotaxis protein [Propionivibrio sp.]